MRRRALVCLVLLTVMLCVCLVDAAERGFDSLVSEIESHFSVRHSSASWLANLVGRLGKPEGVKSFKMAIFEDQELWKSPDAWELDRFIRDNLGSGWKPMVRINSRREGERCFIYVREDGKTVEMMLATVEPEESVLMQFKIDPQEFARMLEDPENIGDSFDR